jgi:hypothetical protein
MSVLPNSFTEREQHEEGRLQYFGFSNMDCGIVIKVRTKILQCGDVA